MGVWCAGGVATSASRLSPKGSNTAAVHENEPNAEMFLEASRFMMKLLDHGDNLDDFGCVLSKRGDEGWNSSVLEQMEDSGVLVRVRGMG